MSGKPSGVPALGLDLDHDRHLVIRGTRPPVNIGGRLRPWKLLVALCGRHDAYYPKDDLIAAVWDEDPLAYHGIEDVTLYWTVGELRRMLHPLDLTIRHVYSLGYRLEDLHTG
jgi:DNA-binding response OmpR family regulator